MNRRQILFGIAAAPVAAIVPAQELIRRSGARYIGPIAAGPGEWGRGPIMDALPVPDMTEAEFRAWVNRE